MASQKGGGVGLLIGLAVSVFLVIILVVAIFMQQSTIDEGKRKLAAAEQTATDEGKKQVQLAQQIAKLNDLIHGSAGTVDEAMIRRDVLKESAKHVKDVLDKEEWFGEEFAKNLQKDGAKLTPREYKNLKEMYQDLFICLDATVSQLNLLRTGKAGALGDLETEKANARKVAADLNTQIEGLRQEKGQLVNKQLEDAKAFDAEKRRLMDANQAVVEEKTKLEEAAAINEAKIRSEVSRLEGRINELTEKKKRTLAETEPDGEIVHADQKLGRAWINIGQKDKVRRGTAFEVFQYVKGGARKIKGHIEVKSLEDETAQVAILDQADDADPIVKGDYIASPFYDKSKTMHFVFVGEKLTNDRYGMEELVRRIEESGGRVDKSVTIDTDFIVAIENAEQSDEFTKGVQFGVVIMREPELLEFLGR